MALRVNEEKFEELVLQAKLPVLIDFYSDTCIPCKKLNGPLGDIEDDNEDKLLVYKVNVNYDEALAKKYEVASVPTLVLFKDGVETARNVGSVSYDEIDEMISSYL
jgi:thioredoxin 1